MRQSVMFRAAVVGMLILSSCGAPAASIRPAAQPSDNDQQLDRIDCHVAYNPHKTGRTETLSVDTPQDAQHHRDSVRFGEMKVRIRYFDDGFESPAFNVIVSSPGAKEDLSARLYQFERVGEQQDSPAKRPSDEYVGGHGFTGLAYEFDPDSNAELQLWCEAF